MKQTQDTEIEVEIEVRALLRDRLIDVRRLVSGVLMLMLSLVTAIPQVKDPAIGPMEHGWAPEALRALAQAAGITVGELFAVSRTLAWTILLLIGVFMTVPELLMGTYPIQTPTERQEDGQRDGQRQEQEQDENKDEDEDEKGDGDGDEGLMAVTVLLTLLLSLFV